MSGSAVFRRELARKTFHLLTLVYLAIYVFFGHLRSVLILGTWVVAVDCVEYWRLRLPRLNGALLKVFGGIIRADEGAKVSAAHYSSLGCWLTVLIFGAHPRAVKGGILFLALGDAAAALAGRAWGRHVFTLWGRDKSWEGMGACFAVCWALSFKLGLAPAAALVPAAAGAVLEALPLPLNDNLWLPLGSALVFWGLA